MHEAGLAAASGSLTVTPAWLQNVERQILLRNALELKPSQAIFDSYTVLRVSALQLQAVEDERQQLRMEQRRLVDRVRELERAAANASVSSSRERELELKKDALQDRLQVYMQRESDYFRGLTEMKTVREEKEELQRRLGKTAAELDQRTAELQLLRKEYTSLRDEYDRIRMTTSEADRTARELKAANEKITRLLLRVTQLETEEDELRRRLQAALSEGSETKSGNLQTGADGANRDAARTMGSVLEHSGRHTDPYVSAAQQPRSSQPSRASMIITDAHSGSTLHSVCVLDDRKHFATSGADKCIRLWDRQSTQAEKHFSSTSIALSLDTTSHYLLAGCADHVVRFWDLNTLRALEMAGHTEKVVAACLSTSAQHAFTASSDSTIKLWDVRRRESLRTLLCQSTCNDVTVAGDTIFSAHYNGKIAAWDRRTALHSAEVVAHQRVATCVRVSSNGQLCVSVGKDNIISVRDARLFTKTLFSVSPEQLTVVMNWARLAVSPDGQLCAVGSGRASDLLLIPLHENAAESSGGPSSSSKVRTLKASVPRSEVTHEIGAPRSSSGPIFCTAWGSNEGCPLVSISEDRCVEVWE